MSAPSSSESDFIDLARAVVHAHCNTPSVSCRLHDEQGYFSKTYIMKLEGKSDVIVQFRETPLDLSLYDVSAEKLGALVPTIEKKSTNTSVSKHVYIMNYIDGSMWDYALGAWPGVVDSYIIPRLQTVLRENIPSDRLELRRSVEELISIVPNLKNLPLSLSHVDLNATNVSKP
ncbi:hypothetical protein M422DRAFT_60044 [Sphaerobolus stellatus SS14]|uniref:Aminoglycoside phosphotransferase domain-containing protein n=1 Tax=Sphaerobolus stellatus (strain SS14) TaxID=990650 RepID=A0A0C9W157_SPHS4|nr:hypothetical protein M422DRAFT_60044 [Sphaerobolus stellatus SS14]